MENIERARAFIEHLRLHSEPTDLMQLRRLLDDAEYLATTPLVEEYLDSSGCKDPWERQAHAMVAKLWAKMVLERGKDQATKEAQPGKADDRRSLGHTIAEVYLARDRDLGIERNFLNLLEAEAKPLPHRLNLLMMPFVYRPVIPIYWPELLADLLVWNHRDRPTQQKWARDFNSLLRGRERRLAKIPAPLRRILSYQNLSWVLIVMSVGVMMLMVIIAVDAILDANAG